MAPIEFLGSNLMVGILVGKSEADVFEISFV